MCAWVDTENARDSHKQRSELAMLVRNYVEGCPYEDLANPGNVTNEGLWRTYMHPTEGEGERPLYLNNLAKDALESMCLEVIPGGAKVQVLGVEPKDRKKVLSAVCNFGRGFIRGENGLLDWARSKAYDEAQGGDGLYVLRLVPKDDALQKKAFVRIDYYPTEYWKAEEDEETGEVLFYRIEYQFPEEDSERAGGTKWMWFREDIYPDRIVKYEPVEVLETGLLPPLDFRQILPILDIISAQQQPNMREVERDDIEAGVIEAELLMKMEGEIAFPVVWHRNGAGGLRGAQGLQYHQLRDLDMIQRLSLSWIEAAFNTGDPPLTGFNFTVQKSGDSGVVPRPDARNKSEIKGGKRLSKNELGPGAVNVFQGRSGENPWLGFPNNLPTNFPHDDVIGYLKGCFLGISASASVDPEKVSHFGQLTGFTAQEMRRLHAERIADYQNRFIGAIEEIMAAALKLAGLAGLLPAAKDGEDIEIKFVFSKRPMTATEIKEMATAIVMFDKVGVPTSELEDLWPFDIKDPKGLEAAMKKMREQNNPLNQQLNQFGGTNPGGGRTKTAAEAGGIDKKAQ